MAEERLTLWLRIRDRLRFKEGMRSAARSVKDYGKAGERSAAQLEILNQISERLEHTNILLAASAKAEARAIDDVGDEASSTTKRLIAFAAANKLSNLGLRRSLTSWRFWKDRLSITRGEIMTTALTIGTYLLPAIVSLGSSLVAASLGGIAVATAGVGALAVGLGGAAIASSILAGQFKQVQTAQDAYTLSVQQYGEGSKEAARAAGHLYAVIKTQGGRPVWQAVRALDALKKSWIQATAPGRRSLAQIFTSGIRSARADLPTFANQTNRNIASLQRGAGNIFGALSGREARTTIVALSRTFRAITGPASRSGANLIIVLMRIMRAAAPWVVRWARSWESTTQSWRRGTRDAGRLQGTINYLVGNLKDWWALTKQIGRTFYLIFRGTNVEGQGMLRVITANVTKFNDWLDMMERSGRVAQFVHSYTNSIGYLLTALGTLLSDPSTFIDRYLPVWANAFGAAAGSILLAFLRAWWHSGLWGKLFIPALLTKWLFGINLFGALARIAARRFAIWFGIELGAEAAAGGILGSRLGVIGRSAGTIFGRAFIAGVVAGLIYLAPAIDAKIREQLGIGGEQNKTDFFWTPDFWKKAPGNIIKPFKNIVGHLNPLHRAGGGMIPIGATSWVGENGPELAVAGPTGTMINPANMGSMFAQPQRSALAVSDLLPPVHVHVDVDRREIGRANVNWNDERKSLRGQR